MSRLRILTICIVSLLLSTAQTAIAQQEIPRPRLWAVYPPGAKIGATTEVKIADSNDLYGANSLIFSHPGITARQVIGKADRFYPEDHPVPNQFQVTVAGNVPEGIYEVRAIGPFGVSNSRRFMVSKDAFQLEEEDNNTRDKANDLSRDTYLAGMFAADYDFYKISAKPGETIVVECLGQRIDSRGDPVLSLLDNEGRELQRSHDVERRDPRIVHQFKSAGDFFVRVNELTHTADGGSGVSPYLLHVSTSPVVSFIEPPMAQAGRSQRFTLFGHNIGGQPAGRSSATGVPLEKVEVTINVPSQPDRQSDGLLTDVLESRHDCYTYRHKTAAGLSNAVRIPLFQEPAQAEQEPNNRVQDAANVTLPAVLTGKFDSPSDVDSYLFTAKKDEKLWIEASSQSLSQPVDALVVVQSMQQNKDGETVVRDVKTIDDSPSAAGNFRIQMASTDPAGEFIAPADGDYRLLIRDQFNGADQQPCYYRLVIRRPQPGFKLLAAAALQLGQNGNNNLPLSPRACILPPGGDIEILAVVHRFDDFKGEVELQATGLPPGVTCKPAIIGPEETFTALVLHAAPDAKPFSGSIQVEGRAVIDGAEKKSIARPMEVLWDTRGNTPASARLTQSLMLHVGSNLKPAGQFQPVENKVWRTARGGKLEIPVKLNKLRDDYSGNASAMVLGMPREIAAPNASIPVGGQGVVKIDVNTTAPAGRYTFHLRADAQVDHERLPDYFKQVEEDRQRIIKTVTEVAREASDAARQRATIDRQLQTAATNITTANRNLNAAATARKAAMQKLTTAKAELKKREAELAAANKTLEEAKKKLAGADDASKAALTNEVAQKTQAAGQKQTATQQAATAVKAAEAALATSEKDHESKAAALKEANDQRAKLQQDRETALAKEQETAKLKTQGDALRREIDTLYNQVRNVAQKRKVKTFVYSPCIEIDIAPFPATVSLDKQELTLQAGGEKVLLQATVKREFGFDGDVTFRLTPPPGVGGMKLTANSKIAKGQNSTRLELAAADYTKPGEYEATLVCQMRFNNRTLDDPRKIKLVIKPAPPK